MRISTTNEESEFFWQKWNSYEKTETGAHTIIEQLNKVCVAKGDNTAIYFKETSISYNELYIRSNQMAHYLIKVGVVHGEVVGIGMDRGVDLIVSILGVLKAGAVFLPLDPQYAPDRINYMISNSEARWLLTSSQFKGKLSTDANIICVDNIGEELSSMPANLPELPVNATSLVYILYTSGSTGKPKGVMIANKSLLNYINWAVHYYLNGLPAVFPLFTSISFDLTITSIFSPLISGNALKIYSEAEPSTLLDQIFADRDVNVVKLTPSHLRLVRDSEHIEKRIPGQHLKLIVGGEDLDSLLAKDITRLFKEKVDIYNEYGPTEATVGCMIHKYSFADDQYTSVPIGVPIANARIYLLDNDMRLVPKGVEGEIYIGGECVAQGYYKNDALTDERFLTDPFVFGGRMYKTGDHAVMLESNVLIFKGRKDNQVKLRGYRIELSEIDYHLSFLTNIKSAVTVVKEKGVDNAFLVSYVVLQKNFVEFNTLKDEWQLALRDKLPEYMIPQVFVVLDELPLTANGKIDRSKLPDLDRSTLTRNVYVAPVTETDRQLVDCWQKLLGFHKIGIEDNFFELGGNSLLAQKLINTLKNEYQLEVPITKLYQKPTILGLRQFIKGETEVLRNHIAKKNKNVEDTAIAVIGMDCNFPGASSVEQFWEILREGRETITFFKKEELDAWIPEELKHNPDYVAARGIVNDASLFDADFFGISPKLAELMDPQHRLFLQLCRSLLEKTGYLSVVSNSVTGVFAGCSTNTYYNNNVVWNKDKTALQGSTPVISVSDKDYISSRVSYQLNLHGPSININTACSTSLVAIAQAVESLRAGQCDTAIAGGAAITVPIYSGHLYEEGSMLSADGHCRPFDADARGTVFSDGVGAVLLKRLEDAVADGDTIYAVVKGVGVNNDGGHKGSFTAPSAEGQAAAISMAYADAHIAPADITYIETHGTATPLGDPIEIEGLKLAFGQQEKNQFCSIGSVKSNMGHLTHAAGVAGFIKTVLSMHHKQLLPTLHYRKANPHINFELTPFVVNATLKDWDCDGKRIAGVSSFGVGGTNAHVVLEEFEDVKTNEKSPVKFEPQLICWSAHNMESSTSYAQKLSNFLKTQSNTKLEDVAYSLLVSRQNFAVRNFIVTNTIQTLITRLDEVEVVRAEAYILKEKKPHIVLLFPGQGNQYPNMGRELYEKEPVYKNAIDECATILQEYVGEDMRSVVFSETNNEMAAEKLKNTRYAQPAIFMTSYALTKLYMSWGIEPSAFAGHSVGEFVGAHFSGIFRLNDVLKIVAERGKLISELPSGSMISVRATEEKVLSMLPSQLSIAAQNAPSLCVVSGETGIIDEFAVTLTNAGIVNKILRTSHAFHSPMMDPAVPALKALLETIPMNVPQIPVMSTVTADWLKDSEATSPAYWSAHARETVQFGKAVQRLQKDMNPLFLETGPGTSSTVFAKQNGVSDGVFAALNTNSKPEGEQLSSKTALGKLWQYGAEINVAKIYKNNKHELLHQLPTYAYNQRHLWVDPPVQLKSAFSPLSSTQVVATTPALFIPSSITSEPEMTRKESILEKLKYIIEAASGIPVSDASPQSNFAELGLDSLLLTQLATSLKKEFSVPVTFRQLSEDYDTLGKLSDYYDANLPANMFDKAASAQNATTASGNLPVTASTPVFNGVPQSTDMMSLITLQLQLLTQQVAMLQNGSVTGNANTSVPLPTQTASVQNLPLTVSGDELSAEEKIDIKKPFGATARIEKKVTELNVDQAKYLTQFIEKYNNKTTESKKYTQQHRAKMADPRVVSGFKPYTKEMVYSLVVKKSKGAYLWDIDDNKYIDALNGFGSNFLGYQPDFVKEAIHEQVENGYEIGPQHVLAGEVSDLICELTNMERAALCNTGSEAVLGAMRIARTVSGKDIIVAFSGSYHGITDEVLVRGSKKMKTYPAASGILAANVQNMLILEYGTEESLKIIKERAAEIAAVLVEPVQSRRPELQPVEFLKELRKVTASIDVALVFDEVITGFRSHLGGVQALFGIKADIATYGKVAGAGISIGIIAGTKKYLDALDGGYWEYGDSSIPEVGVTYFAGTFVRHPLALATTKACLTYLKQQGPGLQKEMNEKTDKLAARLNQIAQKYRVPIYVVHFSSMWKIKFKEEYPYYELLFSLMRYRNIHILDLFPCYLTTVHTKEDIDAICIAFEESIAELCSVGFIPQEEKIIGQKDESGVTIIDNSAPPVFGARLGKDKNGNPAWFVSDDNNPGKYLQISLDDK